MDKILGTGELKINIPLSPYICTQQPLLGQRLMMIILKVIFHHVVRDHEHQLFSV